VPRHTNHANNPGGSEVARRKAGLKMVSSTKNEKITFERFRIKQDKEYISEFDREMAKYLQGSDEPGKNKD
jgi:hypothetical protein